MVLARAAAPASCKTKATHVDHIVGLEQGDAPWNLANLSGVLRLVHIAKENRTTRAGHRRDANRNRNPTLEGVVTII